MCGSVSNIVYEIVGHSETNSCVCFPGSGEEGEGGTEGEAPEVDPLDAAVAEIICPLFWEFGGAMEELKGILVIHLH